MTIKARFFDGKTSASHDVEVELLDDGHMQVRGPQIERTATLANTRISERVGNTSRRLFFADGAICEVADNDTLDDWLTRVDGHSLEHRVFRMERMWHVAVPALLITGVIVWLGVQFGVPALAGHAVKVIPTSVDASLGRESLQILDKTFFEPSELPPERQAEIRGDFERIVADAPAGHDYRLEFRKGDTIGPNAFALPSGIVVMTDELVELSKDRNEIVAVLAHEVGHVVNRHALRTVIQSSATAAIMVGILGDFTSVSTLIGAAPSVLLQAKFSRSLESEADDFAYAWLDKHNIPSHYFGDLLLRMEEEHGGDGNKDSFDYFSSHPSTRQRVRN